MAPKNKKQRIYEPIIEISYPIVNSSIVNYPIINTVFMDNKLITYISYPQDLGRFYEFHC